MPRDALRKPALPVSTILEWVDRFKAEHGRWPTARSGPIPGTDTSWAGVEMALVEGARGLPGGSSLAKLLTEHRGYQHCHLPQSKGSKYQIVSIRVDVELMDRLRNAVWHLGRGLTITSVLDEAVTKALQKLEQHNDGKSFPPRTNRLPNDPRR
jgi:hypothetical protein